MATPIRDLIEFSKPARVVRDERGAIVVEGVKLLGSQSSNVNPDGTRNVYPLEARAAALGLYEGAKVFVNHPERNSPNRERGYEEQLGRVRNARAEQDGNWGDLVLNPKHPLAEQAAWDAEHSPDSLGMSHNAQGRGRVDGKDCLIEEITRVRSVDLVCAGATTRGLFESQQEQRTMITVTEALEALLAAENLASELSVEEKDTDGVRAVATALLSACGEEAAETPESQTEADDETQSLREKVVALEARIAADETRQRREALLTESKLPASARTEALEKLVHEFDSDEQAKALIEHTKRLVFHQDPTSGTGTAPKTETQISSVDELLDVL